MRNPRRLVFRITGWLTFVAASALVVRVVYEQTFMTWQSGLQMLGFTLIHVYPGWFVIGAIGVICAHIWVVAYVALIGYRRVHRNSISPHGWTQFAALTLTVALFYVPYGCWQYATLKVAGPGNEAPQQLHYAATENQAYLVEAFLDAGVPVNARAMGGTALNGACRTGRIELAHYLLSRGGNLDAAPECRAIEEFARRMKPVPPPAPPPTSNVPQVPGITIEVH